MRTLPLRVAPIEGEALDSWLDALAHRHHVPRQAILEHCAISKPRRYGTWMRLLSADDIGRIAAATSSEPAGIDALALPRAGTAVGPLAVARTLPSSTWDWRATSRWCPQCLADTNGRWLLGWRLNWTFACLIHRTLLQDACPCCHTLQRGRWPAYAIPELGRCTEPIRDPANHQRRCSTDLRRVDTRCPTSCDMERAQRIINALLAEQPCALRRYGSQPPAPRDTLHDVTAIARLVFTVHTASSTSTRSPLADTVIAGQHDRRAWTGRPSNPSALGVAEACAVAIAILDAHNPAAAQRLFTLAIQARTTSAGTQALITPRALTPIVDVLYQRARHDMRTALTLRRRFETTAAKSTPSPEKENRTGARGGFASSRRSGRQCER